MRAGAIYVSEGNIDMEGVTTFADHAANLGGELAAVYFYSSCIITASPK